MLSGVIEIINNIGFDTVIMILCHVRQKQHFWSLNCILKVYILCYLWSQVELNHQSGWLDCSERARAVEIMSARNKRATAHAPRSQRTSTLWGCAAHCVKREAWGDCKLLKLHFIGISLYGVQTESLHLSVHVLLDIWSFEYVEMKVTQFFFSPNNTPESLAAETGSPMLRHGTNQLYGERLALRGFACHT